MNVFNYVKDADGIVTITMNMTGPVNCMNQEYRLAMDETVSRLEQEVGLSGVVFTSAKKVFFAGGDLNELLVFKKGEEPEFMQMLARMKDHFRRLEKLPVPVVAAINGAALGGGFELCLACNHRIAVASKTVQIGLPEVTLGLLPGAGGVVRMVNLIGLENALPFLLEGKKVDAQVALNSGLIHQVVTDAEQLLPSAKSWILNNMENPSASVQPWDQKGYRIPGGNAGSPALAQLIVGAPPMLRKKTRGLLPAPEQILDCAIEAARVNFDTALQIESRGLTYLVGTPQAKNLINTLFFQMNKLNSGESRPRGFPKNTIKKVGVLGAGMMGQGIAYVSAIAGIQVILKDVSIDAAEKGKAYSEKLLDKKIKQGRLDETKKSAVLDLITTTTLDTDLVGCDLIIESVFENIEIKKRVTQQTEEYLVAGGVYGSNTSSLPITQLADAARRPENYIGIHFFSPVDKMPLVEIICGEKTSDETLAKAYDYATQIRKTPIVVNDSLAFFTSRTFATYLDEGVRLLHEGTHPVLIDNLGKAIGMPLGPLAVHDEVSLELNRKAAQTWSDMGMLDFFGEQKVFREVINIMIDEFGRGGRYHGGGFYEYSADGQKSIWPKLFELFYKSDYAIEYDDIKDRLLFRQVIETLKCLEENVLRTVADGNIGSLMGIGAPVWTGGFIQFINTYGTHAFIARCQELAAKYGERFLAPAIVMEKARQNELFI